MKYLLAILLAGFIALSFISRQCEHVFTEIEQAAIKIEQPDLSLGGTIYRPTWPTGVQEGKELICVKCFHVQKQLLDYGQADLRGLAIEGDRRLSGGYLSGYNGSKTLLLPLTDTLKYSRQIDSMYKGYGSFYLIDGDSVFIISDSR